MRHLSVKMDTPVEFINVEPLNPLISKCQIKVCYVGDEPNRNGSVITKETAKQMANSLPGCPIVGFYNEQIEDFEEHNRIIDISNGKFEIKDTTKPYGFVDLNAKAWFQKFFDDNEVEHEYLMTEGYLWTEQYPECKRILTKGNNQSMELDEKTLNAQWSKVNNDLPEFFIINEAVISKLCILGEEAEPCFEGSTITNVQFSFEDGFKEQLFSMMNQLTEYLNEGGAKVFTRYAVEIGGSLWNALYAHVQSLQGYSIVEVCEEDELKFAVLKDADEKYYRLNFSTSEESEFIPEETLVEITSSYEAAEEAQFSLEEIEAFEAEFKKKDKKEEDEEEETEEESNEEQDKEAQEDGSETEENSEEEDEEKKKKKKYNLEEVEEYQELLTQYAELEEKFNLLTEEKEALERENIALNEFKLNAEKVEKEAMINSFYMLSDEDKADVIENINTYSLDEIEAKLSVICVRNKVSFNLDEEEDKNGITFNLNNDEPQNDSMPAWVRAALDYEKGMR